MFYQKTATPKINHLQRKRDNCDKKQIISIKKLPHIKNEIHKPTKKQRVLTVSSHQEHGGSIFCIHSPHDDSICLQLGIFLTPTSKL